MDYYFIINKILINTSLELVASRNVLSKKSLVFRDHCSRGEAKRQSVSYILQNNTEGKQNGNGGREGFVDK